MEIPKSTRNQNPSNSNNDQELDPNALTEQTENANATMEVYNRIRQETKPYKVSMLGREIIVYPGVFSPKYFTDTEYFADRIPKIVGQSKFLEMGSGTGAVSVFCSLNGAETTSTDINPKAVENTKENARLNNVQIDVRSGNLFEGIGEDEKFDFIFWNHPWNPVPAPENDVLLLAGFDEDHKATKKFIQESKKHLKPNGSILLGTGGFAKVDELEQFAQEQGYETSLLHKDQVPIEPGNPVVIDYMVYEYKLK